MKRQGTLSVMLLVILFTGCEIANKFYLFQDSLTATKGNYPDKINLSWSDNFGGEEVVDGLTYDIYRDGDSDPIHTVNYTQTSWSDDSVSPGVMYSYQVECFVSSAIRTTNTANGYAMDAAELKLYADLWADPRSATTSIDTDYVDIAWFHFYAQKGWSYDFWIRDPASALTVTLYDKNNIETPRVSSGSISGMGDTAAINGWRCPDSGEYYLKVTSDSVSPNTFTYCARYRN